MTLVNEIVKRDRETYLYVGYALGKEQNMVRCNRTVALETMILWVRRPNIDLLMDPYMYTIVY